MALTLARIAARDNALWCDAVCRAAGGDCSFTQAMWSNRAPSPRFYPNVITLADSSEARAEQRRVLSTLTPPAGFGVKDSFACLDDLGAAGFDLLFEGQWIHRRAAPPRSTRSTLDWRRVRTAERLEAWEACWSAHSPARGGRVFHPGLLDEPAVAILAGTVDGDIAAGIVAHRNDTALGVSNAFARPWAPGDWLSQALDAAQTPWPGLPLVGYEPVDALAPMHAEGFKSTGPLRVWVHR